jgi:hypothetical protein
VARTHTHPLSHSHTAHAQHSAEKVPVCCVPRLRMQSRSRWGRKIRNSNCAIIIIYTNKNHYNGCFYPCAVHLPFVHTMSRGIRSSVSPLSIIARQVLWRQGGNKYGFSSSSAAKESPPIVFDKGLKKWHREWSLALPDSNYYDYLRDELAERVVDRSVLR